MGGSLVFSPSNSTSRTPAGGQSGGRTEIPALLLGRMFKVQFYIGFYFCRIANIKPRASESDLCEIYVRPR
jgi:hypothetical protein